MQLTTDSFVALPTEKRGCLRVPIGDRAALVHVDDRIERDVEQQTTMAHALAQRMLSVVVALAHILWLSHCVMGATAFPLPYGELPQFRQYGSRRGARQAILPAGGAIMIHRLPIVT